MNRILKKSFEFYINSSIHVALAVVALCTVTAFHFHFEPDFLLLGFIFFGTITGYNFVKYAGIAKLHHRSLAKGLKMIQIFSLICFVMFIWFSLMLPPKILYWTALFGTFTLLYALPIFTRKRNLRSISGIKIFIIAFVWAGITVVIPGLEALEIFSIAVGIEFLQRFLLVLVLILPFEIRDLKYDLSQLGTIPQRIGVTGTKILGFALLILVLLLEIFQPETSRSFPDLVLICLVTGVLVWKSKEKQSSFFASFWVEAVPILWLLVLLVLRAF